MGQFQDVTSYWLVLTIVEVISVFINVSMETVPRPYSVEKRAVISAVLSVLRHRPIQKDRQRLLASLGRR